MENNKNISGWSIYVLDSNKKVVTWVTINETCLSKRYVWERALNRIVMELSFVDDSLAGKTFEVKKGIINVLH